MKNGDIVEEILVSVIGATIFSYFLGETLTLSHTHYTKIIYDLPSQYSIWEYLNRFKEAYFPPVIVITAQVILFVTLYYQFFLAYRKEFP